MGVREGHKYCYSGPNMETNGGSYMSRSEFRRKSARRRRRSPETLPDDPDALVAMSVDVPRWLFEHLETKAEESRYSRASIASEWLEDRARRDTARRNRAEN